MGLLSFTYIFKKFPGDDGQVPRPEENYFENEKFSKTHSKKAVLDMSINKTSYLKPLTQFPSGEPGIIMKVTWICR